MRDIHKKLVTFAASKRFFYGVVALLVFEASWIALSSHYPMAFDEAYHLGIIKLYGGHLSPWWNGQPTGADMFGAVYRDPSYLYHWLMSIPYRLIRQVFHEAIGQIIALRLINVAIFAAGLVITRALLLKVTHSKALINLALLFLVLTPVIPSLAGQINYDNLLFLAVPGATLLLVTFLERLRAQKYFDLRLLVVLVIVCLLSSLVKYAFLPIFFVLALYALGFIYRTYKTPKRHLGRELGASYKHLTQLTKIVLIFGIVISSGLFIERYGLNTINYHTPLPKCDQVLSAERCLTYAPWKRNHDILVSRGLPGSGTVKLNAITFSQHWLFVLYRSMFYVLNGPDSSYAVGQPLLLPSVVGFLVIVVGMICLLLYQRQIFKANLARLLLAAIIVIYVLTLWLQNYSDYLHLGQPVALQGRYLIPILAPLYLFLVISIAWASRRYQQAQVFMAAFAVVLFLQGGGFVTFLVRSDDSWYITNSISARINHKAQPLVRHVIIGK
jgi:hypothetical protein